MKGADGLLTSKYLCESLPAPDNYMEHQDTQSEWNSNVSEIKSGTLIMIIGEKGPSSPSSSTTSSPSSQKRHVPRVTSYLRCPVVVKIYKKQYEHYAIVSRNWKHETSTPVFINLKRSVAYPSLSCPSQLSVVLDGTEGRSIKFEASSPECAQEWAIAFCTSVASKGDETLCARQKTFNSQGRKDNTNNDAKDKPMALLSPPSQKLSNMACSPKILRSPPMPALTEAVEENEWS